MMQNTSSGAVREGVIGLPSMVDVLAFILRWWLLLLIGTLLPAAVFSAGLLNQAGTYEATARVAILRFRTAAIFEPRVTTLSSDTQTGSSPGSVTWAAQDPGLHRRTLAQLAVSPEIEQDVSSRLREQLEPSERSPGALSAMVVGKADPNSSLITILVRNASSQKALLIANAWASAYEKRINQIYAGGRSSLADLQRGVEQGKQSYEKAELALTAFSGKSELKEMSRRAEEIEALLAAANKARGEAVHEVALAETKASAGEIVRVLQAEASNRAMALQKEQEAKSRILSGYIDAVVEGKATVLTEQTQQRRKELLDLYAADRKAALLIDRAQALENQLAAGPSTSSGLALLLLKTEAFGSSQALSQTVQLQIQVGSDALTSSAASQLAEVRSLIEALRQWRERLAVAINAKSDELLEAGGYRDVSNDWLPKGIAGQVRKDYLSLFELGNMSSLSDHVVDGSPLGTEARKRAADLAQLPSLQQVLELQLEKTGYAEAKAKLEAQLRDLYGRITEESSRLKNLTLERDNAWDTYTALSKKAAELQVESLSSQQQEVQLTGEAVVDYVRAGVPPLASGAVAAFAGLLVTAAIAFATERIAAAMPAVRQRRVGPTQGGE